MADHKLQLGGHPKGLLVIALLTRSVICHNNNNKGTSAG